MRNTEVRIRIYEVDDEEIVDEKIISISNHWCDKHLIQIQSDGGKVFTILADDLTSAIKSVTI